MFCYFTIKLETSPFHKLLSENCKNYILFQNRYHHLQNLDLKPNLCYPCLGVGAIEGCRGSVSPLADLPHEPNTNWWSSLEMSNFDLYFVQHWKTVGVHYPFLVNYRTLSRVDMKESGLTRFCTTMRTVHSGIGAGILHQTNELLSLSLVLPSDIHAIITILPALCCSSSVWLVSHSTEWMSEPSQ